MRKILCITGTEILSQNETDVDSPEYLELPGKATLVSPKFACCKKYILKNAFRFPFALLRVNVSP